ncbi:hypothetical protein H4219_001274 [Mycoemilia scoparia]|uniref:F-box domain-containing protein n=1 Tax=Mycoemilia scoparia TaxID=417184 RepID=A0A9W8A0I2_9FUNG|nr:hypothetical protein H4219_001274 [Mycoemilia scoparia]
MWPISWIKRSQRRDMQQYDPALNASDGGVRLRRISLAPLFPSSGTGRRPSARHAAGPVHHHRQYATAIPVGQTRPVSDSIYLPQKQVAAPADSSTSILNHDQRANESQSQFFEINTSCEQQTPYHPDRDQLRLSGSDKMPASHIDQGLVLSGQADFCSAGTATAPLFKNTGEPQAGSESLAGLNTQLQLLQRRDSFAEHFITREIKGDRLSYSSDKNAQKRIDFLTMLPYEIASRIVLYADFPRILDIGVVSPLWNRFRKDNLIWQKLFLQQPGWATKKVLALTKTTSCGPISQSARPFGNGEDCEGRLFSVPRPRLDWEKLFRGRYELQSRWKNGQATMRVVTGHMDSIYCVQFDSNKIVTGSRDRTIKFWDSQTLQCTRTLFGHEASVLCLKYDTQILVTGSSDSTAIVWDICSGAPVHYLRGHSAGVLDVAFDEEYIVTCSKDCTIKIWGRNNGNLLQTLVGHHGPVNAVQLKGGLIVSASGDALIKVWDVRTGAHVRDFVGHTRGLACVQFDGKHIVSGSNDHTIRIWSMETEKCERVLEGHTNLVRTLHYDGGSRIVSGSYDQSVKVWDAETGQCLLDLKNAHTSWVFDVQHSMSRIVR